MRSRALLLPLLLALSLGLTTSGELGTSGAFQVKAQGVAGSTTEIERAQAADSAVGTQNVCHEPLGMSSLDYTVCGICADPQDATHRACNLIQGQPVDSGNPTHDFVVGTPGVNSPAGLGNVLESPGGSTAWFGYSGGQIPANTIRICQRWYVWHSTDYQQKNEGTCQSPAHAMKWSEVGIGNVITHHNGNSPTTLKHICKGGWSPTDPVTWSEWNDPSVAPFGPDSDSEGQWLEYHECLWSDSTANFASGTNITGQAFAGPATSDHPDYIADSFAWEWGDGAGGGIFCGDAGGGIARGTINNHRGSCVDMGLRHMRAYMVQAWIDGNGDGNVDDGGAGVAPSDESLLIDPACNLFPEAPRC